MKNAFKKALGLYKIHKGQIFDSQGFTNDSKEKITHFVLFIPLFQKIRTVANISEFSNGANSTNISMGGGRNYKINPRFMR